MIDENLLHRVIDGEATREETRRLEEALRLDPTARERYEELKRLQRAIDSVPRVDPPAGLLQAVMNVVRPRARAEKPRATTWEVLRAAFGRRPGLGLGLAFAAGILLTALASGLAELGPWPRGGAASATMLSVERLPGREIHRVSLGEGDLRAMAVSLSAGDRIFVRIQLEGPGRADLAVGYEKEAAAPLGFSRRSGTAESILLVPEGLRVRGAGAGEYELVLPRTPLVESVEVRLARGGEAYVASLRVRGDR
jgi:hypothetical protein